MQPSLTTGRGVLVITPTYNERDNVPVLVERLRACLPAVEVLVVDDNSPDGTGDMTEEVNRRMGGVHLLRRPGKQGLGVAYRAGFEWALGRDYERVVHMDADLAHDPALVPGLIAASLDVDFSIGSRYVPGGGIIGIPLSRKLLSRAANFYARTMLRTGVRDMTTGFKCWHPDVLRAIRITETTSSGYVFLVEATWRATRAGFAFREVPIVLHERRYGASKMGLHLAMEGFRQVLRFAMKRRTAEEAGRARRVREERMRASGKSGGR